MDAIKDDALDLIFEVTRQGPPQQLHEAQAMDGKLVQIFSAASVVVGLAGVAAEPVVGLMVTAVVAYAFVAAAVGWACGVVGFSSPFIPIRS